MNMVPSWFAGGLGSNLGYDPFTVQAPAVFPTGPTPLPVDPFADAATGPGPTALGTGESFVNPPVTPSGTMGPAAPATAGFDANKLLAGLKGVQAPAAPAPLAPPRAPDAPKATAIPSGLAQLLALMQGVGGRR